MYFFVFVFSVQSQSNGFKRFIIWFTNSPKTNTRYCSPRFFPCCFWHFLKQVKESLQKRFSVNFQEFSNLLPFFRRVWFYQPIATLWKSRRCVGCEGDVLIMWKSVALQFELLAENRFLRLFWFFAKFEAVWILELGQSFSPFRS